MTRMAITIDARGEIAAICADAPVEIYIVAPHVPHDRVYLWQSADIGPEHIRAAIGGYSIGHADDGSLNLGGIVSARLPPIGPRLSSAGGMAPDDRR